MKRFSSLALALGLAAAGLGGMQTSAWACPPTAAHAMPVAGMALLQVAELAQKQHGLQVLNVELDHKNQQLVYEVKGVNAKGEEVKLYLNPNDGQVLSQENKGPADRKDVRRLSEAKVPMADAVATALKQHPGTVVDVDLDESSRVLHYEVKVRSDTGMAHKVRVNAVDGQVLSQKSKHK